MTQFEKLAIRLLTIIAGASFASVLTMLPITDAERETERFEALVKEIGEAVK